MPNNRKSYAAVAASPPSKMQSADDHCSSASSSSSQALRQLDLTPQDISSLSIMSDDCLQIVTAKDYGSHLLSSFSEFREEGMFFDFTLKVGNKSFPVHKAVIAGCSDYFRAMFSHGMQESRQEEMELKSVSLSGVKLLLDFAYTGKLELSLAQTPDILSAATFLQITPAIDLCYKYLKDKMTFENGEELVLLGATFGLTDITKYHRNFILENFMEFAETEMFLKMDAKTLAGYLKEDALRCTTEGQLLKKVICWYERDKQNRKKNIYDVLDKIRYTNDGWPTIEYAATTEPFKCDKHCKQLLDWCHCYMRQPLQQHMNRSYRTKARYNRQTLLRVGGILCGEDQDYSDGRDMKSSGDLIYYHHDLKVWLPCGVNGKCEGRTHHQVVNVNDFAIIMAGFAYAGDLRTMRAVRYYSNEMKMLTPHGFALWDMPNLLMERARFAAAYTPTSKSSGYIYAIGGINEAGPLASVERFNLGKERWRFITQLDKPVYNHAATTHAAQVYFCGGIEEEIVSDRLRRYNSLTESWEDLPPMFSARYGHTFTAVGKYLIACGGRPSINSFRCLSSVEAFDVELKQWHHLTPMRYDCYYMSATEFEGKLLVMGGETSVGDLLQTIQEYNPTSGEWGVFGKLDQPCRNSTCIPMTIKLSKDGRSETDSLNEAYLSRWDQDYYESDEGPEEFDLPGDGDFDIVQLQFVDRQHWP